MPGPTTITHSNVFHDISREIGNLDTSLDDKHLRLDSQNQDKGLYLHGSGSLIDTRVQEKHTDAFGMVSESINQQLKRTVGGEEIILGGGSERILRDVLGDKYDTHEISVGDMRRVAQIVAGLETEHSQAQRMQQRLEGVVDSFAGQLEGSGVTPQELLGKLRDSPPPCGMKLVDDVLRGYIKKDKDWGNSPAKDLGSLKQDLDSGENVWLVLARHGLIKDQSVLSGGTRLLTRPESEALRYDQLEEGRLRGEKFELEGHEDFIHYRDGDVQPGEDERVWHDSGNKVHISVDPEQVGQAWDVIVPILRDNPDVAKHFKVSNMEGCRHGIAQIQEEIAKLEKEDPRTPEIEARINRLQNEKIPGIERVMNGAQITLYNYQPEEGHGERVPDRRFREVIGQITQALRDHGIQPGVQPTGSDLPVDEFVSYRNDKDQDGQYIDSRSPDYPRHLESMKSNPFFLGLTNPQLVAPLDDLRAQSSRVQEGTLIHGRVNEQGGITLHGGAPAPRGHLDSQSYRIIDRREREQAQGIKEIRRMFDQIESRLDSVGGNPRTRDTLDKLRGELDRGVKPRDWLVNANALIAHALEEDHAIEMEFIKRNGE